LKKSSLFLVVLLLATALVSATRAEENVTVEVNADPFECVTRVAVFSETRAQPVKLTSTGSRWVTEPIPRGEVVTISFEISEDCRDPVLVNDVTLEKVYGTRYSLVLNYPASFTIKAKRTPPSYVSITTSPAECLYSIQSTKPVKKEGDTYIIGPIRYGEAVGIRPTIRQGCSFKEWVGDPYAAASPRPDITLQPMSNISLTLVLTLPQTPPPPETSTEKPGGEQPLGNMLNSLMQYLPFMIGAVAASAGAYASYKAAAAAREKRRREEEFQRRLGVAKAAFSQASKSMIIKRGWLWLEVDPVEEVLHGRDIDRLTTAYLMLASVIPISPKMRERLYHETVNEYNAATGSSIAGYHSQASLSSAADALIRLSVQLALEDPAIEKARAEITRRGGDPFTIPRHLIGLDTVVYEARGVSIFDLGFKLEGEEKHAEPEQVVKLIKCPKCGAKAFESFKHCVSCGAKLQEETREEEPAETHVETRPKITQEHKEPEEKPKPPQKPKPVSMETAKTQPRVVVEEPKPAQQPRIEKPPVLVRASSGSQTTWELPKWLVDELAGLDVDPEEFKAAAEQIAGSEDVEKAAYKAAFTIARNKGLIDSDEVAALATSLATLLPYAVQEYRSSIVENMDRTAATIPVTEQTHTTTENKPLAKEEEKQQKPEQPEDIHTLPETEKQEKESRVVERVQQPASTSIEDTIPLDELPEKWSIFGTAYLLDSSYILAPGLPTSIIASRFRGKGRVYDLEKAARTVSEDVLARYIQGGPCLLILTRGRYPRRRMRTLDVEEGYKPLRLLKGVVNRVEPSKLILLTHPAIYESLPEQVINRLKTVKVTLDLEKARQKLRQHIQAEAEGLEVAQALLPELAQSLAEGEDALKKYLLEVMSEDDAQLVAEVIMSRLYGRPISEEVPRALALSLGVVE